MKIKSVLPEPSVLGRRLKPYTLGHDLLLHSIESGFAIGAKSEPTHDDLIASVYLCSFYFNDAVSELCSKRLKLKLALWGCIRRGYDIPEELGRFIGYIKAFTDAPEYWLENVGDSAPRRSDMPFAQILKLHIMREYHVAEDVALNTPFHEAQLNYLSSLEMAGRLRFVSDEDKAVIRAAYDPDISNKILQAARLYRN
jgi:hypothetical protein